MVYSSYTHFFVSGDFLFAYLPCQVFLATIMAVYKVSFFETD